LTTDGGPALLKKERLGAPGGKVVKRGYCHRRIHRRTKKVEKRKELSVGLTGRRRKLAKV